MSSLVYPIIGDWSRYVAERVPSYLGRDPQWSVVLTLAAPLVALDASVASMTMGLDPVIAVGAQLDQLGTWLDEPRAGLDDAEYRRIILGRQGAQTSDGGVSALWQVWLALTGIGASDANIVTVPWVSPLVWFEARLQVEPTVPWRRRAGAVWRDSVAFPIDALGVVALATGLVWNTVSGWNIGSWGSALPYEVP